MDISLIANAATIATQQTLCSANSLLLHRQNCINLADQSFNICAVIVDALSPPPVKSKTTRRTILRRRRRTRRRSKTYGDAGDCGEEYGFFGGGDGDGLFSCGGGGWDGFGGGGRGWNFDKFGGHNWDESSGWFPSRSSDFACGFVYEVIYWIALSNCVHFAFKKVVKLVADGIGDTERGKVVPLRLGTICYFGN
ncbi:F3E22.8 PROTEIN [Salix purpurea]|uniref:F3E22.8 PROTEIN n=1 Tax=Salix purpurea TaxID=77065 RepID=A0A9Q0Z8L1_SALPP|nr:F3E22.8 PROTEIN [Salix purpurea]